MRKNIFHICTHRLQKNAHLPLKSLEDCHLKGILYYWVEPWVFSKLVWENHSNGKANNFKSLVVIIMLQESPFFPRKAAVIMMHTRNTFKCFSVCITCNSRSNNSFSQCLYYLLVMAFLFCRALKITQEVIVLWSY